MGGATFSPAWRLLTVETDVEAARCSSWCSGSSTGTRGSFMAWRWKRRELRLAYPRWPDVNGGRWHGEAATRPPEIGGNGLGQCAILKSFLERKERSGDSLEAVNFDRRAAVVLFTTSGEKLKCGRLTATPAMRLGGEASGS
jgi:hypothetical protein